MTERPDLPSLAWALLRIGAVAFGGLGATLTLLNRDLVERRGWLRSSDVSEALAYTSLCPARLLFRSLPSSDGGLEAGPARSSPRSCFSFLPSRS
jgi:hypothetical protein